MTNAASAPEKCYIGPNVQGFACDASSLATACAAGQHRSNTFQITHVGADGYSKNTGIAPGMPGHEADDYDPANFVVEFLDAATGVRDYPT